MITFRSEVGPFQERPFFRPIEIDRMCEESLLSVDLLPKSPEPIRIERFVEKYFKVSPTYDELPNGVLGFTTFSPDGVKNVSISKELTDAEKVTAERRINSTLAHEAGHGLMHAYLFSLDANGLSNFGGDPNVSSSKVLCRDEDRPGSNSRWWEVQANMAIGSFLLPRKLFQLAVSPFLVSTGPKTFTIPTDKRVLVERTIAETFDVNPIVARIRLNSLFPLQSGNRR